MFCSRSLHPLGLVRERTMEYQRHLNKDIRGRKISITSSEGFSDDYGEEEKTYKDIFRSEKTFMKSTPSHQTFLKTRANQLKEDSSPPSSDEHEWVCKMFTNGSAFFIYFLVSNNTL